MKELKPLARTRFKCDFCKKVYVRADKCTSHERICYMNPNRHCDVCYDSGTETYEDGYKNPEDRPCIACKKAWENGIGKSYLQEGI